jgi:uncharacterized membrane protein
MQPVITPIVRGLATLLPPLLTLLVLLWLWRKLDDYVVSPAHRGAVAVVAELVADVHEAEYRQTKNNGTEQENEDYVLTSDGSYIPANVMEFVREHLEPELVARNARDIYRQYVELRWLPRRWFVPASFCGFLGLLYVAGLIGNRSFGKMLRERVRRMVNRIPFVRQVNGVVIQVTQHFLAKPPTGSSRVVAVEFPRKNVWCLAYVIKKGLAEVANQAEEPVLTVFMDTSPIPMSGYTIMVKQSETVSLPISLDDAFRFVISCGIIVPPNQRPISKNN